MSKLVLIDGNAILHRAYHALPALTTSSGEPINAVYGFVSMLLRVITDLKPTHIAVAFDRPEPTFRQKAFKEYQAQRPEMEKELSGQFEKTKKVVEAFGIPIYEKAGFEADDVIGTLARRATEITNSKLQIPNKSKIKNLESKINEVVIVTGDRDILQLVNDKVKVYLPVKGISESKLFGINEVVEKMGVKPELIPDYKALVGDPSDNYPGVAGIGPKTAISLLNKYGGVENVYKNLKDIDFPVRDRLKKGKQSSKMSHNLATIVRDVPLDFDFEKAGSWEIKNKNAIDLFKSYGFKTLTNRIMNFGTDDKSINLRKNLTKAEIEKIVVKIAEKLDGNKYVSDPKRSLTRWAIRGTAGMVLQGLDMGVDDIDITADKETSLLINKIFKEDLIDEIKYSESDKFRSYFGKIVLDNILVEIMGNFQVKDVNGLWSEKLDASDDEIDLIEVDGQKTRVTKLELELKTSIQMGRWNELGKIKKEIEKKNQQILF